MIRRANEDEANIDAKDGHGWTALSWATRNGHEAIIEMLLDKGATVDAADEKCRTPLLLATENGHEACVKLLLDNGANVNANSFGGTP